MDAQQPDHHSGAAASRPPTANDASTEPQPPRPTDATAPAPQVPGHVVEGEIARGGMGVVYRARELALDREVAIKVLQARYASDPDTAARFVEEARVTAQLQHPGIPPVHHIGTLPDGRPFLVMKLIRGRTLDFLLREQGPGSTRWLAVFEALAQAVGYAHARRVLHRDLKPSNIMVGAFGEVQVMDWGLAKLLETPAEGQAELATEAATAVSAIRLTREGETAAGSVLGTPAYMASEQAIGAIDQLDTRTDVFGLGAVLCAMLTGKPPYQGPTSEAIRHEAARARLDDAFARLESCDAEPELVTLCRRCLSPDKADRPADGGVVAAAVASLRRQSEERARQAELEQAQAETRAAEQQKRRYVVQRAGAGLVVVLLAGVVGTTWGLVRVEWARDAEGKQREQAIAERNAARKARNRTRDVLDAMTSFNTTSTLGTQPQLSEEQKNFLTEALTYYHELADEDPEDEETRFRIARAAHRVGIIEYRLGRMLPAVEAFHKAKDALGKLAKEVPGNPAYRSELGSTRSDLGTALDYMGKSAEAVVEFRQALVEFSELAQVFPSAQPFHEELSLVHSRLALLLGTLGKSDEATEHFRQAISLLRDLTAGQSVERHLRQWLANTHNSFGSHLRTLGRPDEAEAEYRQAQALGELLARDDPKGGDYRLELARSYNDLGNLFAEVGKREAAEEQYRLAAGMQQELVREYPGLPLHRQELARSLFNLGKLYRDVGRLAEAESESRRSLEVRKRLCDDHPKVVAYRYELATSHNDLGLLLKVQGKLEQAAEEYRQALAIRESLVREFPDRWLLRVELGGGYCNFANLLRVSGKPEESLPWYDKAIALLGEVTAKQPALAPPRVYLRNSHSGRSRALHDLGRFAEALQGWERVLELSPPTQQADYRASRAGTLLRAGKVSEAVTEVEELAKSDTWDADQLVEFARVQAVAQVRLPDRPESADRAVELLRRAVRAGYKDADRLAKEPEFERLRARTDFQELLTSLMQPSQSVDPSRP